MLFSRFESLDILIVFDHHLLSFVALQDLTPRSDELQTSHLEVAVLEVVELEQVAGGSMLILHLV